MYDTSLCQPPTPWTNVWLVLDEQSTRPITITDDGGMCAIAGWAWKSEDPCATDADVCDAAADSDQFLNAQVIDEPTEVPPTATPTPRPNVQRAPAPAPVAAQAAPAVPLPPRVVVVTQVVPATPVVANTPTPVAPTPTLLPARMADAIPISKQARDDWWRHGLEPKSVELFHFNLKSPQGLVAVLAGSLTIGFAIAFLLWRLK